MANFQEGMEKALKVADFENPLSNTITEQSGVVAGGNVERGF